MTNNELLTEIMDMLTQERYSAACSSGIATEPITQLKAEFLLARDILLYNKGSFDTYQNKLSYLMGTNLGEEYILNHDRHRYGSFIPIPEFEMINKEYTP